VQGKGTIESIFAAEAAAGATACMLPLASRMQFSKLRFTALRKNSLGKSTITKVSDLKLPRVEHVQAMQSRYLPNVSPASLEAVVVGKNLPVNAMKNGSGVKKWGRKTLKRLMYSRRSRGGLSEVAREHEQYTLSGMYRARGISQL
jgi:hypothetical protein